MTFRLPPDPDGLARLLGDYERRLKALEQAPVVLGAYRIAQRADGALVARHQATGHETVIGSPS